MSATHTAGPWTVELCGGENNHRRGYYVYRMNWGGRTEWMKDRKGRIAVFAHESAAHSAIARATGGAV